MNNIFAGYGDLVVNRITSRSVCGYIEKKYHRNGQWAENGRIVSGIIPTIERIPLKFNSVVQAQDEADQFGAKFVNLLKEDA